MFNNYEFNNSTFNEISNTTNTLPQDDIVYNGFGLQNATFVVTNNDFDNGPRVDSDTFMRPLDDGSGELNYFFRNRTVNIEGYIKSDSAENLNNEIDRLKSALGENNKDLDIKVNGVIRRAKASVVNFQNMFDRQSFHISTVPFNIQFRVLDPFFKNISRINQTLLSQTGNIAEELVNTGTVKTDPVVQLTFTSATSVTSIAFNSGDDTITLSETISASDIVLINGIDKIVTVNDITKDYTGTFPEFQVGSNPYTITINGTKDYNMTTYFFNKYL